MSHIECEGVVEEVTDYLEGALDEDTTTQVTSHLENCWACVNYVGEIQVTIQLMSDLPAEPISGELESNLLDMYREWAARVQA
jgi:anti-sigma factor RsiW